MNLTPEQIEAVGKVVAPLFAALMTVLTTFISSVIGYFTWKNRYELDKLYAAKYRPNQDGSPGPMRKHPKALVRLFQRKKHERKR